MEDNLHTPKWLDTNSIMASWKSQIRLEMVDPKMKVVEDHCDYFGNILEFLEYEFSSHRPRPRKDIQMVFMLYLDVANFAISGLTF